MDPPPKIRAFIALGLRPEVDRALLGLIEELRTPGDGVAWSRASNLHLTLRFLGPAVDSSLVAPLADALRVLARETAPFVVVARGIGAFPDLRRPRVIWAGLEGDDLIRLAAKVEAAAVQSGFEPERRPYAAHLTLGRVKSLKGWRQLREKLEAASARDFGASRIESLTLYRSELSPAGSIYHEIERFAFTGGE